MVRSSQANKSFDTLLRKLGNMTTMVITMIAMVIMRITMTLIIGKGCLWGREEET